MPLARRFRPLWLLWTVIGVFGCGGSPPPGSNGPTRITRDAAASRLPQTHGTLEVAGLTDRVEIRRDRWGIVHIYARNQDDLFFAQGFVQAQDRLFQMDLWRRTTQGRLAEILGPQYVQEDRLRRRLRYRGDMDAEWTSYAPDGRQIVEQFVNGINAWVAIARRNLPIEFTLAGHEPEVWRPADHSRSVARRSTQVPRQR